MKEYISETYYQTMDTHNLVYKLKKHMVGGSAIEKAIKESDSPAIATDMKSPYRTMVLFGSLFDWIIAIKTTDIETLKDKSWNLVTEVFKDHKQPNLPKPSELLHKVIMKLLERQRRGSFIDVKTKKEVVFGHIKSVRTTSVIDLARDGELLKQTGVLNKNIDVGKIIVESKDVDKDTMWGLAVVAMSRWSEYPLHFLHGCMWAISMGYNKTEKNKMKRLEIKVDIDGTEKMLTIISQIHLFLRIKHGSSTISLSKLYYMYVTDDLWKKASFAGNDDYYKTDNGGVLRHQFLSKTATARESVFMVKTHYNSKAGRNWKPGSKFNMWKIMEVIYKKEDYIDSEEVKKLYDFVMPENLSKTRPEQKSSTTIVGAYNKLKTNLIKEVNSETMMKSMFEKIATPFSEKLVTEMKDSMVNTGPKKNNNTLEYTGPRDFTGVDF